MSLSIRLDGDQLTYEPGQTISGTVEWQLTDEPKRVELSLAWFTEGKGDQDVGEAQQERWEFPGRSGEQPFRFDVPNGPWSFSGRLITLSWALEAVAYPTRELERLEIVISPTGEEIRLGDAT